MSAGLAFRLRRAAARLEGEQVALGTLADAHGSAARGTLLVLTALPCMLPVPGTGTVLGLGLVALAFAMWRGQDAGVLPARVAAFRLPRPAAQRVLRLAASFYARAGRWSRTRWPALLESAWLAPLLALFIAVMALLIVLPIPFGNVLPALAVIAVGIGLAFRDGLAVAAGAATGVLAVGLTAGLGAGTWLLGSQLLG